MKWATHTHRIMMNRITSISAQTEPHTSTHASLLASLRLDIWGPLTSRKGHSLSLVQSRTCRCTLAKTFCTCLVQMTKLCLILVSVTIWYFTVFLYILYYILLYILLYRKSHIAKFKTHIKWLWVHSPFKNYPNMKCETIKLNLLKLYLPISRHFNVMTRG